jgi:hypothetical protein
MGRAALVLSFIFQSAVYQLDTHKIIIQKLKTQKSEFFFSRAWDTFSKILFSY